MAMAGMWRPAHGRVAGTAARFLEDEIVQAKIVQAKIVQAGMVVGAVSRRPMESDVLAA